MTKMIAYRRPPTPSVSSADGDGEESHTRNPIPLHDDAVKNTSKTKDLLEFNNHAVSTLNECKTTDARYLCIFDLDEKLKLSDEYDIGGTYGKDSQRWKPEIWFYCTTSLCPGETYLLNVFVYYKKIGSFEIGISDSNLIAKRKKYNTQPYLTLSTTLTFKSFKSIQAEQSHHIKTYCFTKDDVYLLNNNCLCIPVAINMQLRNIIDRSVLWRVKTKHDSANVGLKRNENTDFTLISKSGSKYETHKRVLAAYSTVIRDEIRKSASDSLTLDITDTEMQLLFEYFYTGNIKDIQKLSCQLLKLADKLKLENLFNVLENTLSEDISMDNAVDILVLSEKYKLKNMRKSVFEFIKANPDVLATESWKNLNDVSVTKKLITEVFSDII